MKNTSKVLDVFYVYSIAELEAIMPYIQAKCFGNNARAYINLNELDSERAALGLLKKCADLILQKEFRAVKNVYATVCGNLGTIHAKR